MSELRMLRVDIMDGLTMQETMVRLYGWGWPKKIGEQYDALHLFRHGVDAGIVYRDEQGEKAIKEAAGEDPHRE